jgi:hypothetical protein
LKRRGFFFGGTSNGLECPLEIGEWKFCFFFENLDLRFFFCHIFLCGMAITSCKPSCLISNMSTMMRFLGTSWWTPSRWILPMIFSNYSLPSSQISWVTIWQ